MFRGFNDNGIVADERIFDEHRFFNKLFRQICSYMDQHNFLDIDCENVVAVIYACLHRSRSSRRGQIRLFSCTLEANDPRKK